MFIEYWQIVLLLLVVASLMTTAYKHGYSEGKKNKK